MQQIVYLKDSAICWDYVPVIANHVPIENLSSSHLESYDDRQYITLKMFKFYL